MIDLIAFALIVAIISFSIGMFRTEKKYEKILWETTTYLIHEKYAAIADLEKRCAENESGEWEVNTDEYEICATEFTCSNCKESFISGEMTDEQFLQMMKYCPNCGAKMGGENE